VLELSYNNICDKFKYLKTPGIDLLNRMLTYDPDKRITAHEALSHPYFSEKPYPKNPDMMPTFPTRHSHNLTTHQSQHNNPNGNNRHGQRNQGSPPEANSPPRFGVGAVVSKRDHKREASRFGEVFGSSQPSKIRKYTTTSESALHSHSHQNNTHQKRPYLDF